MSLVLNMVGGGGGGSLKDTDAILTVTVPTGSTVTMTKGGVTLTPTMWVQAADNTLDCALFVIQPSLFDSVNAWTVTATRSGDTASDTVTISSNEQYDLNLGRLNIYIRGRSFVPMTAQFKTAGNGTIVFGDDYIQETITTPANSDNRLYTTSPIDITAFSKLVVVSSNVTTADYWRVSVLVTDNVPNYYPGNSSTPTQLPYVYLPRDTSGNESETILDISNLSGEKTIGIICAVVNYRIHEIYLLS